MNVRLNSNELTRLGIKKTSMGRYRNKVDLHLHSLYSDTVACHPTLLVRGAEMLGLRTMAITDHSMVYGSQQAQQYARENCCSVQVIPGIEIDVHEELIPKARLEGQLAKIGLKTKAIDEAMKSRSLYKYDVLGYCYNPQDAGLFKLQENTLKSKRERMGLVIDKMNVFLESAGALKEALDIKELETDQTMPVTRNHLKEYLKRKGYEQYATKEIIDSFMAGAYKKKENVNQSIKQSVEMIHEAGGLAFLAHPLLERRVSILTGTPRENPVEMANGFARENRYFRSMISDMLSGFKAIGGDGVEVLHTYNFALPGSRELLEKTAKELNMLMSGGSDFYCGPGEGYYADKREWFIGIAPPDQSDNPQVTMSYDRVASWLER